MSPPPAWTEADFKVALGCYSYAYPCSPEDMLYTAGSSNSPPGFLCYAGVSLAGNIIGQGAGVVDLSACAQVCGVTPGCTLSEYVAGDMRGSGGEVYWWTGIWLWG